MEKPVIQLRLDIGAVNLSGTKLEMAALDVNLEQAIF